MIKLKNLEDTNKFAEKIASLVSPGAIIFLKGDLGTGKTTFAKAFAKALGTDAKSPSFGLVNIYEGDQVISHLDLYRLKSYEEALGIGIEEILDDDSIKLIEWPEILGDEPYDLSITFSRDGIDGRAVEIEGPMAEEVL
uniref:tRNA (adenosine(37)-N6)-threonylcarbamoyltransferase complex ATPase subunit type 1 TsaE n=1 Tax=Ezakiella massiliensis TaxID=1852374 RepID=UPI00094E8CA0|nr:tRNA (adenosine(37)-N6)-threonylcarbamoyltransferase complex ATPase subunit type 1 TsaE [Ezakiella massiliensis]